MSRLFLPSNIEDGNGWAGAPGLRCRGPQDGEARRCVAPAAPRIRSAPRSAPPNALLTVGKLLLHPGHVQSLVSDALVLEEIYLFLQLRRLDEVKAVEKKEEKNQENKENIDNK